MRIGQGYDVHAVEEGRKLILGGVEIPHKWGLKGHSDADVLLHAVMDALLGAAGLGDIGKHFPDTDNKYKDISSLVLLEEVAKLLDEHTYIIENIDATIVAQEPKLLPYMEAMKENIAKTLGISIGQINIKATTEERLGFTGNLEGMKSYAICLLTSVSDAKYIDVTPGGCGGCCSKM
jgi:ygbB family